MLWAFVIANAGEGRGKIGTCSCRFIVPIKEIEYGVYGNLILIYPKPYAITLRGTIGLAFYKNRSGLIHKRMRTPEGHSYR